MDAKKEQPNKAEEKGAEVPSSATEENQELGIKRVRTFAEDLALAREKAGVKEEVPKKKKGLFGAKKEKIVKPDPKKDLSKIQPEVDMSKAPQAPEGSVKPSREFIEQELAKSGIVANHDTEDKNSAEKGKTKSSLSAIRTYKYDAAESIEEKGTSRVSMLAAEQKRRVENEDFSKTFSSPNKQSTGMNIALVVLSVVLVAVGVWGAFHFYNKSKLTNEPAVVVSKNVLFTDSSVNIDSNGISGQEFRNLVIENTAKINGSLNDLTELVFQDKGLFGESKISKNNLFKKLEGTAPSRLVRNLRDDYLIGVHSGEVTSAFYLFKIDDFDTVFAGILEWEGSIHRDLYGNSEGGLFEDTYLRNKDTRVQKDQFGNTKLIYAFPNSETLLITKNEEAFFEVFERLTVSNATQN